MKLTLLLISLLFLSSCTQDELQNASWFIFILIPILIFFVLPREYPKFWWRTNSWQKYPDGFYKDIHFSLPSFSRNPFKTIEIRLQKDPVWCTQMKGTIEFIANTSCHIGTLELEIDTNDDQMNVWIEVDDAWEITWRSLKIPVNKDCVEWMPENISFSWDILARLDTRNPSVKEAFESYRNIDDGDLAWERDRMKNWFEAPQFQIKLSYKNKEIYKSKCFDIADLEVQEYIRWL